MRNRAKCRKCEEIIESYHLADYVTCKCGEISIDGGSDKLSCAAKDWSNFLRVDDLGNEIIVKVTEKEPTTPTKKDLLNMLDEMIRKLEELPSVAMSMPITHYDHVSSLILLSAILRSFCKDES